MDLCCLHNIKYRLSPVEAHSIAFIAFLFAFLVAV